MCDVYVKLMENNSSKRGGGEVAGFLKAHMKRCTDMTEKLTWTT